MIQRLLDWIRKRFLRAAHREMLGDDEPGDDRTDFPKVTNH